MSENTVERNGKSYRIIDPDTYIDECEWNGIIRAEKNGYIIARKAEDGERVNVTTQNGNHEASETAKKGDWIVTRADEDGHPVLDENGNRNSWIVGDDVISQKYESQGYANREELFFKPNGGEQEFMRVQEDVAAMVPWGENGENIPLTVDKGGYLNITDPDDVYGIAEDEFNETYAVTETIRSEVDRDIYEANHGTPDANVNAIIEKLAEQGIKAFVDHDADVKEGINVTRKNELENINSDRSNSWYGHETTVLRAVLPNGINMKIITDEVPDRAAVAELQAPVSETYHHEDAPEDRARNAYRPEVDYRLTHIQGSIGDVTEKIAEAGRAREISYGELISASVQKYFPEKADEIADSLLVRSELTADEKEMLISRDQDGYCKGYYSPNKTIIVPEGETMEKDITEALTREVEECGKLKETLRSVLSQGDAELREAAAADPQTQGERVGAVKDCQRFLNTVLKNPVEGPEKYGDGIPKEYHELDANKAAISAALSSDSLESCHMVTEATERYKDMLLNDSAKEYNSELDGEYMSFLEAEYGDDFAENHFASSYVDYQERNHNIEEIAVAPASFVVQDHYYSAIRSVYDVQKNISKDVITQLAADTQGVTHDDVSANFGSYEVDGLDSAQLLEDSDGNRSLQVTYSDGHCFNAIMVNIPVEDFDDPASAVSAAAKYSQTKEEFEKEMPNLSYEETYTGRDMTYVEDSEILGEVRYDDEIDRSKANVILGIEDEPEEEREEASGANRHMEHDDYDDIEL